MSAPRRQEAVIGFAACFLFFALLGQRGLVSEEVRWGIIAREMRHSGDLFHPTINGQLYFDKPLASYWLILGVAAFSGDVDEWTARAPSAISGLAGLLLLGLLGRQCYDARVGALGIGILASSFGYVVYSRRACADMENLVGVLAAIGLAAGCRDWPRRHWVVGFWLVMGITSSMKGLLGFALPLWVLGCDSIIATLQSRHENHSVSFIRRLIHELSWLFNRWTLFAAPLGIAVYLFPYFIAAIRTGSNDGLAMVFRENLQRFVSPHNHTGPVTLYLSALIVLAAPWSLFLPAAAAMSHNSVNPRGHRLILCYFWGVLLFFAISASRRSYYLLPILPPLSLLLARLLLQPWNTTGLWCRRGMVFGLVVYAAGLLLLAGGLILPKEHFPAPWNSLPEVPFRWALAIAAALCALLLVRMAVRRTLQPWILLAVSFGLQGVIFLHLLPFGEQYRSRRIFADEVHQLTAGHDSEVALYHARDVVFELAPAVPLRDYSTPEDVASAAARGTLRWLIIRRRYRPQLTGEYRVIAQETTQPWERDEQLGDKMELLEFNPPK